MIDASFFIDESLLDCHIKKQSISVKAVEFDEIDMKIINSNSRQLTLLQKADLLKRIFDYPHRDSVNSYSSFCYAAKPREPIEPKLNYANIPMPISDQRIIDKTINHSYFSLKSKVLKNRSFRQNLINLKKRTQQLLSSSTSVTETRNPMDEEHFQSKVDAAIMKETEKGRVRCPFCPRRCFLKENMRAHLASHNSELPYTCNQCDQRFRYKEQLVCHHRIHMELKPFRCNQCDKGFTQVGNLQRHQKIHDRVTSQS